FNILLQVLDDGYLTDSSGQRVSLTNTIIIMTTNIGGDATGAQLGFGTTSLEARDKHLRQFLRPELLNRMTKIIAFDHLSDTHLKDLVTHRMTQLKEHARNNNCTLRCSSRTIDQIVPLIRTTGGARALDAFLQQHVEEPLLMKLLKRSAKELSVRVVDNSVTLA